jgi:hypothetical protein
MHKVPHTRRLVLTMIRHLLVCVSFKESTQLHQRTNLQLQSRIQAGPGLFMLCYLSTLFGAILSAGINIPITLFGILNPTPATIYLTCCNYHAARVGYDPTTFALTERCAAHCATRQSLFSTLLDVLTYELLCVLF